MDSKLSPKAKTGSILDAFGWDRTKQSYTELQAAMQVAFDDQPAIDEEDFRSSLITVFCDSEEV